MPAELHEGQGGLRAVTLSTAAAAAAAPAATATVHLHGATLTSWVVDGEERIFLSPLAVFQPPKAIRGGVPVCFPQFGNLGPLKAQHGFARNRQWKVSRLEGSSCSLCLESDEETLQQWPHAFRLELTVTLHASGALQQVLRVTNTDGSPFEFTTALHTYFRVSDVGNASVAGLRGLQYFDNAAGSLGTDGQDAVTFPGEVDRAYIGAPGSLRILDSAAKDTSKSVLAVQKRGFQDAVVWSPGEPKAAGMADLGAANWRGFVCLEVAQARSGAVALAPGEAWEGSTTVEVGAA